MRACADTPAARRRCKRDFAKPPRPAFSGCPRAFACFKIPAVKRLLLCLLLSALAAWGLRHCRRQATPDTRAELAEVIRQAGQRPGLSAAAIGFCLLDADGRELLAHQAHTAFMPASSLKTVTTATALERLGPDFTFQTRLAATAPLQAGVIAGDLVVTGGADPTLGLADLQRWVAQLRQQGLQSVQGRILGDGRALPGSIFDDFWNWGDLGNGYGSPVAGLNLEHNRYTAVFRPAAEAGAPAAFLGARPEVPGIGWVNEVRTGAADSGDGVVIHGGERTARIHLRGTVPAGRPQFQVSGAVPDPETYAAHHLRRLLLEAGIAVAGEAAGAARLLERGEPVPAAVHALADHRSPPLRELIASIHATSDNHETECLFRWLGVLEQRPAEQIVREHWRERGLSFEGLRLEDGCGLARADFIRPLDLARLQGLAGSGPHGALYRQSLPSLADGRLRYKGGAMSGIRCYTGLVTAASGAQLSFALMINHFTEAAEVHAFRDQVLELLLRL